MAFGDGTVTSGFDNGHLRVDTGWEDLRFPADAVKVGTVNPPSLATFQDGLVALEFSKSSTNQVYISAQMPHSWRGESAISPHVHWSPGNSTETGDVRWGLEYSVAEIGSAFPASTTIYATQAGAGVAYSHQLVAFADIDMTGVDGLSTMILFRLFRDGGDGADTFDDANYLLEFDIHYQISSLGSYAELVKFNS